MITILLGVILITYMIKNSRRLDEDFMMLGIIAGALIIIGGILIPMDGFTEPIVEEIELMPLKLEDTNGTYYLKYESGNYIYAFDNSDKYGLSGAAYEQKSIQKSSNVKLYESEQCTVPILKKFRKESKISWYSIAGMWSETEYIFYIPIGTKYEPTE